MPKANIAVVRGVLSSFTEITPAKLNRSGRNLTEKRGLRWDARLENFAALRTMAARWRWKNRKLFCQDNNAPFGALRGGRFH